MSALFEIIEKIQDTEAALAMAERAVARNPRSETLAITAKSIQKRRENLEGEFSEIVKHQKLDVCSYRIFSETQDNIKIASLANALHDFQSLFTTVFDALKNGPKDRARVDAATAAYSAFDFGYCFSGSAGIVMTMPQEMVLIGDSDLDRTITEIFEMAKATKPEQLKSHAKRLGLASVRKVYQWVTDHLQAGAGADIQWKKNNDLSQRIFIQVPQLEALQKSILDTSEETEIPIEVSGELVGFDSNSHWFHFKTEDGVVMKGGTSPKIGTIHTLEVPKRYTISALVKRKVHYATEQEDVSYFLLEVK
jgi:hypothetical protein